MYRTWNDSLAIFDQEMHDEKNGKRYICESEQKVDNMGKYIQNMKRDLKLNVEIVSMHLCKSMKISSVEILDVMSHIVSI